MARGKPHPGVPFFEDVGNTLGEAYLRYSFTKGTGQEVAFLLDLLALPKGARLLDVGCGPGRHAVEFAKAGLEVVGVDVSRRFLEIAAQRCREAGVRASFFEVDARQMPFDDEFDAVISLCQGGFGLMGGDDSLVLRRMAESLKPRGRVVMTAFSALFEAAHSREGATFDADAGVVHEHTTIKDESGEDHDVDLWTSVYTPRELRLLAIGVGLVPERIWAVEPGAYGRNKPDCEHPEFLMVATKPDTRTRA
jgi:SAM-dependent methyltransferase